MTAKQQLAAMKAKHDDFLIQSQRVIDALRRDAHNLQRQLSAEQQAHAETKRLSVLRAAHRYPR